MYTYQWRKRRCKVTDNARIVLRAIEYIESKLSEDLRIKDVADEVGFSLYHFIRTFNSITRHSPKEYVVKRRLSKAAVCLIESEKSIVNIALECGFNSHETFTRAFKKMFHQLPKEVRKSRHVNERHLRPMITREYIDCIKDYMNIAPNHQLLTEKDLVGFSITNSEKHYNTREMIEELIWIHDVALEDGDLKECYGIHSDLARKFSKHVSRLPLNSRFIGFTYIGDVEYHPLFVEKRLKPVECASFDYHGEIERIDHYYTFIYQSWLPKSGYVLSEEMEIEKYSLNDQGEIAGIRISIPVVRADSNNHQNHF